MEAYADLADLPEDERIRIIAEVAAAGKIVGFVVDDDANEPGKADRYIEKLKAYPVRFIDRKPGPVKGATIVRIGPKEN